MSGSQHEIIASTSRALNASMKRRWSSTFSRPEAYAGRGERTAVFYVFRGLGQHSSAEVAMPGAQVVSWRAGRMVHVRGYMRREDALSALGVSEDDLEPIAP
jgi:hypothetical protein